MSAAIRSVALVLGVLLVASTVGVYVFDLLPASAPGDAPETLGVVAIGGAWLTIMAVLGGHE